VDAEGNHELQPENELIENSIAMLANHKTVSGAA
jgi:hypothetical protein